MVFHSIPQAKSHADTAMSSTSAFSHSDMLFVSLTLCTEVDPLCADIFQFRAQD